MWSKERFEADAAKALGEPVIASVYMVPQGRFQR